MSNTTLFTFILDSGIDSLRLLKHFAYLKQKKYPRINKNFICCSYRHCRPNCARVNLCPGRLHSDDDARFPTNVLLPGRSPAIGLTVVFVFSVSLHFRVLVQHYLPLHLSLVFVVEIASFAAAISVIVVVRVVDVVDVIDVVADAPLPT